MTAARLSWDQVLAWRMGRQHLELPSPDGPVEVVRRLCGVQAQVASAAEMAIGVRLAQPGTGEVASALRDRAIIKIWAMRGTLHLLAPDVAGAFLSLIATVKSWERPSWQKDFITSAQLSVLIEAVREILDGRVLSREDLTAEVLRRTGDTHLAGQLRSGWGAVLKPLAWQGLLCHADADGSRVTFTSPRTLRPDWGGIPAMEDAARVAIARYLGAYGPASMEAFDAWLTRGASSKATLRGWFAAAGDLLTTVEIEGEKAFARTQDVEEIARTRPTSTVRLLPAFDQYVLGPGTGDSRVIPPAHRRDVSRAAGWIAPVVVAGGRVVGTWEARDSTLEVTLFRDVGRAALEAEAGRIRALLGRKITLSVHSR